MAGTLKEQLAREIATAERDARDNPTLYEGPDWWQLSPEEEAVFEIDRRRWPRMMTVWHCYEALTGVASGTDWDVKHAALLEKERAVRPALAQGGGLEAFTMFGKEFGGLTYREAHAVFAKQDFHAVRGGVMTYADEPK